VTRFAGTIAAAALVAAAAASASTLEGPGRFCGYSPIIDLLEGERITTLTGGIHGGTFRWEGAFGTLEVQGIGWASEPDGRPEARRTARGHVRFATRRRQGSHEVAIWNGRHGAAYFRSPDPLTRAQLAAIDRVDLFDETDQEPQGCKLRTVFAWE